VNLTVRAGKAFDVIVLGGGPSGAVAAVAAARLGANTLVVEQYGCLGGALTAMGVGPMMSFHNNAGKRVIGGIPHELVGRLIKKKACLGHLPDTYCKTVTPFDPEALRMALDDMLRAAGGRALFHTQLADAKVSARRIRKIIVCNKAGLTALNARVFIDATGDADLAAMAGVPFTMGREKDHACQPMTMNLRVANVDTAKVRRYIRKNPGDFRFNEKDGKKLKLVLKNKRLSHAGFEAAWNRARARGEVTVPREHILFFEGVIPGVYTINVSRIQGLDATRPEDLSRAEVLGRKQCDEIFRFLKKYCPGFENSVRMDSPAQVGVRESRHILCRTTLTRDDLVRSRPFPDAVALGGYPVDIHSPGQAETQHVFFPPNTTYQIPLRCLLPEKPENLVVVGRSISATHEAAAAVRVTPIVMAIGQAGGTLAGLAVKSKKNPTTVPARRVQDRLRKDGACLPRKRSAL
jgi:hypothetical protein